MKYALYGLLLVVIVTLCAVAVSHVRYVTHAGNADVVSQSDVQEDEENIPEATKPGSESIALYTLEHYEIGDGFCSDAQGSYYLGDGPITDKSLEDRSSVRKNIGEYLEQNGISYGQASDLYKAAVEQYEAHLAVYTLEHDLDQQSRLLKIPVEVLDRIVANAKAVCPKNFKEQSRQIASEINGYATIHPR